MSKPNTQDEGSIIITMLIMLVTTALISALLISVYNGLTTSRRYGDSANALQLSDAAVNDAVKSLGTAVGSTIGPVTKTLGSAGTYKYSATLDSTANVWHIDAYGYDTSGKARHVKAEAVPEPLFSNAFFFDSGIALPSGVALDSFTSGNSTQTTCSRHGVLGTNDPAHLTFNSSGGNGNGQQNCTDAVWYGSSNTWVYPVDGCIGYHDPNQSAVYPPQTGQVNACPPTPYTALTQPKYAIPSIKAPAGTTFVTAGSSAGKANDQKSWPTVPCDANHHIAGGARYYVSQVVLLPGCQVDALNGPAIIYTTGAVSIGQQNGGAASNRSPGMNPPDTSHPLLCPNYAGTDWQGLPRSDYCPGWSSNLQIYMTDGNTNTISFGNAAAFWGVVMGENAAISTASQVQVWGAMRVSALASGAQLSLHYDEALGSIGTGIYQVKDWREEPTQG
jgi:hypothetical protein